VVKLYGEPVCAGLLRPKNGVVSPNLGDGSGRHKDHGTTENTEITERRTRRSPKEGNMIEEDQINRTTKRIFGAAIMHVCRGPAWNSLRDLCGKRRLYFGRSDGARTATWNRPAGTPEATGVERL